MDDGLALNDPYKRMDNAEEDIQPDFLKSRNGGAQKTLGAAEKAAQLALAAKGGKAPSGGAEGGAGGISAGGAGTGGAKNAAKDGLKSGAEDSGAKKAEDRESSPEGLYNKKDQDSDDKEPELKMPKGVKMALVAAAPMLLLLLMIGGVLFMFIGLPVMMIGAIDYNIQKVLGFEDTVGILEEQGEHVTAELAASGKMPKDYFNDLVANGIDVGQVTANGDFVRTDTYIANIEDRDDLVASAGGFSYVGDNDGELAMLFDGKVIYADDFVAEVESDPALYAAYSNAANLGTKYYYSEDVEKVYRDMGVTRGNFNDWETTGNYEEDEASFYEIVDKVLATKSNVEAGGYHNDEPHPDGGDSGDGSGNFLQNMKDSAETVVSSVADKTREYIFDWLPHQCQKTDPKTGKSYTTICWDFITSADEAWKKTKDGMERGINSVKRAVNLVKTAASSEEPFLSALVFNLIEEPLQRARVNGDGPVNVLMNALTNGKLVSYQDVATGEMKSTSDSILETDNFRATVSDSKYSKEDAANFSRDRILKVTGMDGDEYAIKNATTNTTSGQANSTTVVRNGILDSADEEVVRKAEASIELANKRDLDSFQSAIGGNRIIEGGSFTSDTINMKMIGAMPSGASKISEYHQEVKKVMARKAEAERATKSPFDITSPNTFLGSIVHNIATAVIGNYGSGLTVFSAINSASDTTGKAVANLMGSATAEGADQDFTTMSGDCATVGTVKVKGDLYCSSHNTASTKYISNTEGVWESIIDKDGFEEFVTQGMDRYATVGIKSAEVCEKVKGESQSLWSKLLGMAEKLMGTYDSCKGVDESIATGAKYSFGDTGEADYAQNELYSGYALYEEVRSLLTGEQSAVGAIREEYYTKHPLDNSRAGVLARRSGLEKYEAEIALAYSDYLNEIANYNPAERYYFGGDVLGDLTGGFKLKVHSDKIAGDFVAWYMKETEFKDLRELTTSA